MSEPIRSYDEEIRKNREEIQQLDHLIERVVWCGLFAAVVFFFALLILAGFIPKGE